MTRLVPTVLAGLMTLAPALAQERAEIAAAPIPVRASGDGLPAEAPAVLLPFETFLTQPSGTQLLDGDKVSASLVAPATPEPDEAATVPEPAPLDIPPLMPQFNPAALRLLAPDATIREVSLASAGHNPRALMRPWLTCAVKALYDGAEESDDLYFVGKGTNVGNGRRFVVIVLSSAYSDTLHYWHMFHVTFSIPETGNDSGISVTAAGPFLRPAGLWHFGVPSVEHFTDYSKDPDLPAIFQAELTDAHAARCLGTD